MEGSATLGGFSPSFSGKNSACTSVTLPPDFSNPVQRTVPAYLQQIARLALSPDDIIVQEIHLRIGPLQDCSVGTDSRREK